MELEYRTMEESVSCYEYLNRQYFNSYQRQILTSISTIIGIILGTLSLYFGTNTKYKPCGYNFLGYNSNEWLNLWGISVLFAIIVANLNLIYESKLYRILTPLYWIWAIIWFVGLIFIFKYNQDPKYNCSDKNVSVIVIGTIDGIIGSAWWFCMGVIIW